MLYKQPAIAVMVAVMLGGASLLGGFPTLPALATHDPDAMQLASEQISQESDDSMILDAIELTAKKSTLRTSGTVTVEIIQNDAALTSGAVEASDLQTSFDTVEVGVTNVNVTGSFKILVEYIGTGLITVSEIGVVTGTEVASTQNPDPNGSEEPEPSEPEQSAQELENIIATKTVHIDNDQTMDIQTVKFEAKKSTLRSDGTITAAIVQGDKVRESVETPNELSTFYSDREASFDVEVTGEFQVVFMYEGTGLVTIRDIEVPGGTTPAQTDGNPEGTVDLTVKAVNQDGEAVGNLYVAVLQEGELVDSDFVEHTFTLAEGEYTVFMDNFISPDGETTWTFVEWDDGSTEKPRTATLNDDKTYTATYNVVGPGASTDPPTTPTDPPTEPSDPPTTPSGESGTLIVRAFRVPSPHWGGASTFTGFNAQMWFVLYDSNLELVMGDYFDENGTPVTGLNDGETYFVSPTDCFDCHGSDHDVVFDHWEDGTTERQRPVTTGMDVSAYYRYVP